MGITIDHNLCNGCGFPEKETPCNMACPGDLILMNNNGKAEICSNSDCWDCAACIKICPKEAIEINIPFKIVGKENSLKARAFRDKTVWTIKDSEGNEEKFETIARSAVSEGALINPEEFSDVADSYEGISKSFTDLGFGI